MRCFGHLPASFISVDGRYTPDQRIHQKNIQNTIHHLFHARLTMVGPLLQTTMKVRVFKIQLIPTIRSFHPQMTSYSRAYALALGGPAACHSVQDGALATTKNGGLSKELLSFCEPPSFNKEPRSTSSTNALFDPFSHPSGTS